jgi:hypothetical protein
MQTLSPVAEHTDRSYSPRTPEDWIAAADVALTQFVPASLDVARARARARCVDGLIIGTGQADFTQDNTAYTLGHQGRTFSLIDVPGIEGDERKFTHLVAQAIAKAHLVFYVNGTNKKPEATTVTKIQSYLGRGTQVCVLVNVKEYADAYEFENDRDGLDEHAGARTALRQTEDVLSTVLKPERLLPGQCVQGLLAFSALALESPCGNSTVHPTRSHDLGVHQRKYLRAFGTAEAMRTFSRIDDVAGILTAKAQTFREDIIEANKSKVRELLAGTLEVLDAALKDHQSFMARVASELATSRAAVDQALASCSRLALGARQGQVDSCFNSLDIKAQTVVSEHFGNKAAISGALKRAFKTSQDQMVQAMESELTALLGTLEADLHQAVERLLQNLQRADFERRMTQTELLTHQPLKFDPVELNMALGLGDWGKIVLAVGGMAFTGAQIGMAYPPFGVFIGAGVGLMVGAVLSVLEVFSGQAAKIRKAQAKMQERLTAMRSEALAGAAQAHDKFMAEIRSHVDTQVRSQLVQLHTTLTQPGQMVEHQIKAIGRVLRQVEDMPYGTVQAVRL